MIAHDCNRQLFLCYNIFNDVLLYTLATRMAQVKFELYSEGDDIEDYLERVELI